jgi:hypothetical protein
MESHANVNLKAPPGPADSGSVRTTLADLVQARTASKMPSEAVSKAAGRDSEGSIIHNDFSNVVFRDGKWVEISCALCGATAPRDSVGFFRGFHGMHTHLQTAHRIGMTSNLQDNWNARAVSEADVKLMKAGEQPLVALKFTRTPRLPIRPQGDALAATGSQVRSGPLTVYEEYQAIAAGAGMGSRKKRRFSEQATSVRGDHQEGDYDFVVDTTEEEDELNPGSAFHKRCSV